MMKFSVLILGSVSASHFRAGSVTFLQSKNPAEIIVERTRSWRLEAAGIFRADKYSELTLFVTVSNNFSSYSNGTFMT